MNLWFVLSILSAAAAGLVALPFLRRFGAVPVASDKELDMYREQARELDRELDQGLISQSDAAATRREIEKRVLAVAKADRGEFMSVIDDSGRYIGITITVGWVVVGSVLLYGVVGRPEFAGMATVPAADTGLLLGTDLATLAEQTGTQQLDDVDTMIASLSARLEQEPDDLDGWQMLGWSYFGIERYEDSATAYTRAVELAPDNADLLSLQAEALVRADDSRVGDGAIQAIERSLAIDPANPRSLFLKGLAFDQAGDATAAVTLWLDLLDASPPGAVWVSDLKDRIRERAGAAGVDLGGRPEFAFSDTAVPSAGPGPTTADIEAAAEMTEEDRQAMIRSMVSGLAARLATSPDDLDGWLQLVQAYFVLGETTAASEALATARATFAENPTAIAQINSLADGLGVD